LGLLARGDSDFADFAKPTFFKPWDGLAAFERAGVGRAVAGRARFTLRLLGEAALLPSPFRGDNARILTRRGMHHFVHLVILLLRGVAASPHERSARRRKQVGSSERWRRNGDCRFRTD